MALYLLMQLKIDQYYREGKIKGVTIRRQGDREWLPIFEIEDEELSAEPMLCGIRVRTKQKERTWADPRLLVKFLMDQYDIEECSLLFPKGEGDEGERQNDDGET